MITAALAVACLLVALFIASGVADVELERAKRSHAEWIAYCLHWTELGLNEEAKFAAEQVVVLREEINFLRKMVRPIEWLKRRTRRKVKR